MSYSILAHLSNCLYLARPASLEPLKVILAERTPLDERQSDTVAWAPF